jgi:hypothetical protein
LASPQTCFPNRENAADAVPSWYPARAGAPLENRTSELEHDMRGSVSSLPERGDTHFDAVRSIVAEFAYWWLRASNRCLKKAAYKQQVTDEIAFKMRHFRAFSRSTASHHSSRKLA